MSRPPLHFDRIAIHRAPGVPRGESFTIDGLVPTVNLVHGPNGIGKTTTARIIHELFWPGRTGLTHAAATGAFRLDGATWQVELEAGAATWYRDGQPADPPPLGEPEHRALYHLALDRLIQDDDAAFARQIARETQGGYDLAAAADALRYRASPGSRGAQRKKLQQRQRELRAAQQQQRAIDQEAHRLDALRAQKRDADDADRELDQFLAALEHVQQANRQRQLKARLESYPKAIAELTGQELDQARNLAQQRGELERHLREQRQAASDARRQRDACNLPDDGVPAAHLTELRELCKRSEEHTAHIERIARERARAVEQERTARRRIGESLTDAQLEALDAVEIDGLTELAREAERVRAQRQVLGERRRWLADDSDAPPFDVPTVRNGLTLLGRWLATSAAPDEPRASSKRDWLAVLAAALAVALGVVLAVAHHWLWAIAALVGAALAALTWPRRGETGEAQRRAHFERDYADTGLPAPLAWSVDDVAAHVGELCALLAAATLAQEKAARRATLEDAEAELAQQQRRLDEKHAEVQRRFGATPALEGEWLAALVDAISQWQHAADHRRGLDAEHHAAQQQLHSTLTTINDRLAPYGYAAAQDAPHALALIDDLAGRQRAFDDAVRDATTAERTIERTLEPQLAKLERDFAGIFQRLALEPGDETTLARWLEQRDDVLELTRELHDAAALLAAAAQRLEKRDDLVALSESELEARIAECRQLADRREELINQIVGIEKNIEHAKAGHDVADALTHLQHARDELADTLEEDSRSVVGHLLTEHVRQTTVDRARPAVFRRASEVLARITRGRFRLELTDDASDGGPGFLGYDELAERTRPLQALSVGERVQVLLAVRLGFLEHEERGARLPLLMDETLGNADDERAGAIIDAIIEIARDGRQVFYFSAQADEVGKWCARLSEAGVEFAIKDLQQVRGRAAAAATPLRIAAPQLPTVPRPNGESHESYGRRLDVPGLDPHCQSAGQVHLWHVVEDPATLHALLAHGIHRWGQLRSLMDNGAPGLVPADADWRAGVRARAAAIEAAFDAWRVGRSRPIDRAVLEASGAVSEHFIDEVTALLHECAGDPERLIAALDEGRVSRWRSNKTDELREYLEAEGALDPREPASADRIRVSVLSRVARELEQGLIEPAWIERLLAMLPAEPAIAAQGVDRTPSGD